jgi:hypothetical protein
VAAGADPAAAAAAAASAMWDVPAQSRRSAERRPPKDARTIQANSDVAHRTVAPWNRTKRVESVQFPVKKALPLSPWGSPSVLGMVVRKHLLVRIQWRAGPYVHTCMATAQVAPQGWRRQQNGLGSSADDGTDGVAHTTHTHVKRQHWWCGVGQFGLAADVLADATRKGRNGVASSCIHRRSM